MMQKRIIYILLLVALMCKEKAIYGSDIITGNQPSDSGKTFSFSVKEYAQAFPETDFFVAADPLCGGAGKVNEFALSVLPVHTAQFSPIAPEKVRLNGIEIKNPLFDQGISHLALLEGINPVSGVASRPIVVTASEPKTIYLINFFNAANSKEVIMVSAASIPDAQANETSGVVGLAAAAAHIFAAVRPSTGESFGEKGSGIAMTVLGQVDQKPVFQVIDAPTGSVTLPIKTAFPLDKTSSLIRTSTDVLFTSSSVDMHWNKNISRLYIALQVESGPEETDGVRGLVMGYVNYKTNQFSLAPIISDKVLTHDQNQIVGSLGAHVPITIHKVRSMMTSTSLNYLILLGGNGTQETKQQSVYALPLINGVDDPNLIGTIAAKTAIPKDIYFGDANMFQMRSFVNPVESAQDMPLATDAAVCVGGQDLSAGPIANIFVHGDTVFACVKKPFLGKLPGIYSSHPLFDKYGRIKGWTQWRRAVTMFNNSGAVDNAFAAGFMPSRGNTLALIADNEDSVNTVKITKWGNGDAQGSKSFIEALSSFFLPEKGGIQGIVDFPATTVGLHDISSTALLGYNSLALVQTGTLENGLLIPHKLPSLSEMHTCDNGTITQDLPISPTNGLYISGGVLNDIGPLTTAAYITAQGQGWFVVGGRNGLALLSNIDGSGWDATKYLTKGFAGLTNGMSFKRFGNYRFVRKIVHDNGFLYILSDTQLDRIDLNQSNIALNSFSVTTLAKPANLFGVTDQGSLLDVVISDKLALLATNIGIFRTGNGQDVRYAQNISDMQWTQLAMPEGLDSVLELQAISSTGNQNDFAKGPFGGHVYGLTGSRSKNQARIHRYVINPVDVNGITDDTIHLFPDIFIKNIPSYFLSFGSFRNHMFTDGSLLYSTRNKNGNQPPLLTLLFSAMEARSGILFLGARSRIVPIEFAQGRVITGIARNCASGNLMMSGDFNLRVNE